MSVFYCSGWGSAVSFRWTSCDVPLPPRRASVCIGHQSCWKGTLPSQTCKPSPSNVCALLPLKTLNNGAVEAWGGGVHTCVPVITFWVHGLGCGEKKIWVGWAPFSVFRILLFGVNRGFLIQMNCVAQKWGERRRSASLSLSASSPLLLPGL